MRENHGDVLLAVKYRAGAPVATWNTRVVIDMSYVLLAKPPRAVTLSYDSVMPCHVILAFVGCRGTAWVPELADDGNIAMDVVTRSLVMDTRGVWTKTDTAQHTIELKLVRHTHPLSPGGGQYASYAAH